MPCIFNIPEQDRFCKICSAACDERPAIIVQPATNTADPMIEENQMPMEHEKLIFDNRSSQPLSDIINEALDAYYDYFDSDCRYVEVTWNGLLFHMTQNARSRTIRITDLPKDISQGGGGCKS